MTPCWVEVARDRRSLFTVNTASGTILAYRIAANGALTLLPGSTPAGGPSAGPVDARLSPGGGFLYVDHSKAGADVGAEDGMRDQDFLPERWEPGHR